MPQIDDLMFSDDAEDSFEFSDDSIGAAPENIQPGQIQAPADELIPAAPRMAPLPQIQAPADELIPAAPQVAPLPQIQAPADELIPAAPRMVPHAQNQAPVHADEQIPAPGAPHIIPQPQNHPRAFEETDREEGDNFPEYFFHKVNQNR